MTPVLRNFISAIAFLFPIAIYGYYGPLPKVDYTVPPQPGLGYDVRDVQLLSSSRIAFKFSKTDGDEPTIGEKAICIFPSSNPPQHGIKIFENSREIGEFIFPTIDTFLYKIAPDLSSVVYEVRDNPSYDEESSYTVKLQPLPSGDSYEFIKPESKTLNIWFNANNQIIILSSDCRSCSNEGGDKHLYRLDTLSTSGKVLSSEKMEYPPLNNSPCGNFQFLYSASENLITLIDSQNITDNNIITSVWQYSLTEKVWRKQAEYPISLTYRISTEDENKVVFQTRPRDSDHTFRKYYLLDVRRPNELTFIGNFNLSAFIRAYNTETRMLHYSWIAGEVKKVGNDYKVVTKDGHPRNYRILTVKLPKFKHEKITPLPEN